MDAPTFVPEAPLDVQAGAVRSLLTTALREQRDRLGGDHDAVIGGDHRSAMHHLRTDNPAAPHELVGRVPIASINDVHDALDAAWRAYASWRDTPDDERVGLLLRVADAMRSRAADLAALVLIETGKTWGEAVGEVAESIDFLTYHASQMHALRERQAQAVHTHPLERNAYRYRPLGAGVLLPTWPFPIAQTTGMLSAAVVTGNTAVVKPASLAPVTAAAVVGLWFECGAPAGVVNVVFGPGPSTGRQLVAHPDTRFVTLTGHAETGLDAFAAATASHPCRRWFTRVNLELSGKNAVVVDETADLDDAAAAIVSGAFSFQGQKCSAGSLVAVVASVHDALVERIAERTRALRVGDPSSFDVDVGPLIDDVAMRRTQAHVAIGRTEGRLVVGGENHEAGPRFVTPAVFDRVSRESRLATEEFMGPIVAIVEAVDVDDAFHVASGTPYGLTGAYFSRDEDRLRGAADRFDVGSLYLNRKTTASEVGFHPFGGYGLSGTDAKAGGPDYLMQYIQPQVVSRRR